MINLLLLFLLWKICIKMKKQKNTTKKFLLILLIILIIFCSYLLIKIIQRQNNPLNREVKIEKTSQNQTINTNDVASEEQAKEDKVKKEPTILTEYEGYSAIAKLKIPIIDLETYVLSDFSEEALQISVTKFYGGNPNEPGNFCISGHNYVLKNMFHDLKNLNIDDEIYLTDALYRKVKYKIYDIFTVYQKQTTVLSQETNGKTELTLITCTSDSKKRIIIKAEKNER